MDNTMTVRDHSKPCDHKEAINTTEKCVDGEWRCWRFGCPGGKEIVLRRWNTDGDLARTDRLWVVEADNEEALE
jgi:hypothetical protein